MPVQTRQPLINSQTMTYGAESPYHTRNAWGHNAYANVDEDQLHHAAQVHNSAVSDMELKNECSEETEATERIVARRGIGPSRRRAFQKLEDREQTAQTRKDKACLRCRMQKVRVIESSSPTYRNLLT